MKRNLMSSRTARLLAAMFPMMLAAGMLPAQQVTPPPMPDVRPNLPETDQVDSDKDRIAENLEVKLNQANALRGSARDAALAEVLQVELVFKDQITQQQIDDFQLLGGEFAHVFTNVSFGWSGTLPLSSVETVRSAMGDSLLLIEEAAPMELHMITATQTGRVRPIWDANFAGIPAGINGDSTITVSVVDTGVDDAHTDMAGRSVFWTDTSSDAHGSAQDVGHHGTHVSGIAVGSGSVGGSAVGTLNYTASASYSGVPNGSFFPGPVEIEHSRAYTITQNASWADGGTADLHTLIGNAPAAGWGTWSGAVNGASVLNKVDAVNTSAFETFSAGLLSNGAMTEYAVAVNMTNYQSPGDGFNRFSGVAPGANYAHAKVFTDAGSGLTTWTGAGIDALVAARVANNIKVMNLSLGTNGTPGISVSNRGKVNTAVDSGIVVVVSAGNDGTEAGVGAQEVDDPGRASKVITVASSNDVNQLTDYTSNGFTAPSASEDYKPDVMAPGGSDHYSHIMSVDSNDADAADSGTADVQANDYYNIKGTSMAAPFVAGCAALVIDAMQQDGIVWDHSSNDDSLFVKMILSATATESNNTREISGDNPTLQRAAAGPSSWPAGKDPYEGYGMINPDAAIEAILLDYSLGSTASSSLGGSVSAARAWARTVSVPASHNFDPTLTVPAGADLDLYIYSMTPSATGAPVILDSSTNAGVNTDESASYTPGSAEDVLVVVKLISGSGSFDLDSTSAVPAPAVVGVTSPDAADDYGTGDTITIDVEFDANIAVPGSPVLLLETGTTDRNATFDSIVSGDTARFTYTVQAGDVNGDLDYTATTSLSPAGSIRDSGNTVNAVLTLAAPGAANSLGLNEALNVDGIDPSASTPTDAGAYSTNATVTFNWAASTDPESGVATQNLEVGTSPGVNDVLDANVAGTSSNATGSEGDTLYARLIVTDNAGNSTTTGNSDGILIDTIAPTSPTPTDAGVYSTSTSVTFNWAAPTDGGSGVDTLTLQVGTTPGANDVYDNTVAGTSQAVTGSNGDTLYARLIVSDNAGNTATSGNSDGILIDATGPSASAPADPGVYSASTNVTFNWGAPTDTGSGVQTTTLQVGTTPGGNDIFDAVVGGTSQMVTGADNDTLYGRLVVTDNAGNVTTTGNSDGILIDTTDPSSSATEQDAEEVGTSLAVDFTSADAGSGLDSTELFVKGPGDATFTASGETPIGTTTGTFNYPILVADEGVYEFATQATDNAGNVGPLSSGSPAQIVVNTVENTPLSLPFTAADMDWSFPMEDDLLVMVSLANVTVDGDLTVTRTEGVPGSEATNAGLAPANLISQWWTIEVPGSLAFDTATVVFQYDDALLGSIAEGDINTVWKVDGTTPTVIDIDGSAAMINTTTNEIAVNNLTSLSYFFMGDSGTTVPDWTTLD